MKDQLIQAAFRAAEQSYSPYSHFCVGAAILGHSGKIHTGCNVENASYPAGICAERTAVFKAVSDGERSFQAIAIVGYHADKGVEGATFAYPCGVCRQVLNEFCSPDMPVYVAQSRDHVLETALGELLPHSFGPEHLLDLS